jgi:hypothetical protein
MIAAFVPRRSEAQALARLASAPEERRLSTDIISCKIAVDIVGGKILPEKAGVDDVV